MKKKVFYDAGQAYNYLINSILRLDRNPIYIMSVEAKGKDYNLFIRDLLTDTRKVILYSDDQLNLNPVPLGFCNVRRFYNQAYYTFRLPARTWSIGLNHTNFGVSSPFGSAENKSALKEKSTDLFASPSLVRTIMNDYPSIEQAAKTLKETRFEKECIAFSRNFALSRRMEVIYGLASLPIGEFNGRAFNLKDEYAYLHEMLLNEVNDA